ncbi:hypothetical protein [Microterricola gilva]|uniref:hypothetical protein n=1 Tax=Microterricola gilva TaxID=393267 RepID=UPI00102C7ED6|nr:hypothetical protein [Microterricola gilva]
MHTVLDWCAWYTRGLPEQVAGGRRDEIASDLHEHATWAAERGIDPRRVARGIRLRALGGVISDLSWRRQQLRRHETPEQLGLRRSARGGLPILAYTLALMLVVGSGFVVIRVAMSLARQDGWFDAAIMGSSLLALAVGACALGLLARARTRWLGALWMIVALYCLLRYGAKALLFSSASYQQLFYTAPFWDLLSKVLIVGLSLFFLGMAVRWMPERHATTVAAARQEVRA